MVRVPVLSRLRIDPFLLAMAGTVLVATLLPARGGAATVFGHLTQVAVALVFFLHGCRLSPRAALDGMRHWRLHLFVLLCTFALFPLLGLAARLLVPGALTPQLYVGVMFLCTLPSTVQSSIAFTSIARGNVAAAICAASFSNLVGVVLTPVLVAVLLGAQGGFSLAAVGQIVLQLLVPFLAGQVLRRWIGGWVGRHKRAVGLADRGSVLLVVYTAFAAGVVQGIWHQLSVGRLLVVVVVDAALLGAVLLVTGVLSGPLGFSREDRITIVFCGSKKSLASGLPMASVLFAGHGVGLAVLPLMLFHQLQLMVCAALAQRWGRQADGRTAADAAAPAASASPG